MTFDEQLRRAFDTVAGRLRDDLARHTQAVVEELAAAAETDREQAAADARAAAEQETDARLHVSEREADTRLNAAVAAAASEARQAATREADARLTAAVAAAEASQREGGHEEGRRVGILEGRRQAEQESDEKVDAALAAARVEWQSAERDAGERLVHAIRSIERARSLSAILDTLGAAAAREVPRAAVLLLARGPRFRSWKFIGFGPSFDEHHALEFGVEEAGVIHEATQTGMPVRGGRAGAPAFAELRDDSGCIAVPITLGGKVVAVLYGDHGSTTTAAGRDPLGAWPQILEVLGRHAAGCLETQTALKAAGIWNDRPAPHDLASAAGAPPGDSNGDDDLAARRYARLLVSEIKLYHEADVVAGRRDRDLAKRLGGEIARARVLYDQRVAPHIRETNDYFHAELIQTLANGDETLLEMGT
jgi:hypothetical protein